MNVTDPSPWPHRFRSGDRCTRLLQRARRFCTADADDAAPAAGRRGAARPRRRLAPALEPDDVRAAISGRAAARHLQPHARRRERRAGHQGNQPAQPLHRRCAIWRPKTSPSSSGCRSCSAALALLLPARRGARHGQDLLDATVVFVYFGGVLALVVRLQAVSATATTWRRRRR